MFKIKSRGGDMKKGLIVLLTVLGISGLLITNATATNIALNADITLNGDFFVGQGPLWSLGTNGTKESIVDGAFLPEGQQWNYDSVWWSTNHGVTGGQYITIDLGGLFNIDSFIVQADDNDAYKIEYLNNSTLEWTIVNIIGGWGLRERPEIFLSSTITTSSLKLSAHSGDGYYSVSEVQAFGSAVPEPTTMLLFGTGIAGLAAVGRRRK